MAPGCEKLASFWLVAVPGPSRDFPGLQGALSIHAAIAEPRFVAMVRFLKGLGGLAGLCDPGCTFGII